MSTILFGRKDNNDRILFGSDTDVTFVCYVKLGRDTFIEHQYWTDVWDNETFSEKHVRTRVMTRAEFEELFQKQWGTPMQFMSKDDFEKFVNSGF